MSRKASALAELFQASLSSRTVYLKCVPAPVTFSERRAVLRAVQKITHETVEAFKKLEDNSSFVVVTTIPGTATALVNDSPFTRVIIEQDPNAASSPTPSASSWGAEYDLRGTITTPINPYAPSKLITKETPALSDLGVSYKSFTLHMFAANKTFNHKEAIRRNPLHGPWPPHNARDTFVSAALRRSLPPSPMAPALRDWHTANQLSRDSVSFADEGVEGAATVLLGKKRLSPREIYYLDRIRSRRNTKGIPPIMKSLAAFANEDIHDSSSNAVNSSTKWRNLRPRSGLYTDSDTPLGESSDDAPSDQEVPPASEDKVD
ncbi:hypothetical protein K445DRAFT_11058 [Daldinia sp. EC12]|nr:hypothetical protein F4774DRAFT_196855 [Daldinia eschscholtzii]OTB16774.1 hypothetical protein K445DRAFT_11058 [Daldinia sp. EC12]